MLWTEKIVYSFDRVEGGKRHFNEDSIPITHCTIPQTWEFKGKKFLTVFRFVRNKSSVGVYKIRQMEFLTFVIELTSL